jgi:lipoprotein-releasing system ATP-binding protein
MPKVENAILAGSSRDNQPEGQAVSRSASDVRKSNLGLNAVDLRKSFLAPSGERIEVLRGVTLSIAPGESVAITGASGSGKSTLLHLIGGLDEADHGIITLSDLAQVSELGVFGRSRIGFVFQFHYLLPDLSAAENVALPLLIARHKTREALVCARNALKELGMEGRADHPVAHLSGGEQQRVAVARALILKPQLVLADEPTGNLDATISEEIGKTLINYARTNLAILLVATHNEGLARLCDRVLLLKEGRISSG